jgi:hypothetical protein
MISSTSTSDFTCTEGPYGLSSDKSMMSSWALRSPTTSGVVTRRPNCICWMQRLKTTIYIQNLWIKVETSPSLPNTALDRSTETQNFRKIFQNSKDKTEIINLTLDGWFTCKLFHFHNNFND